METHADGGSEAGVGGTVQVAWGGPGETCGVQAGPAQPWCSLTVLGNSLAGKRSRHVLPEKHLEEREFHRDTAKYLDKPTKGKGFQAPGMGNILASKAE